MMISAIGSRLWYLRLPFTRGFWRWCVARIDSTVTDHLLPWTRLQHGERRVIHPSVSFRSAQCIELGRDVRIQSGCVLWASPNSRIRIGDHTGLGPGTMIFSSNHQFRSGVPYVQQPWTEKTVTIGRDVWVGAGTIIVPGVAIGDGCVVAAGSVVTRSIPPGSIAAGVPARVIRLREGSETPAQETPAAAAGG